MTRVLVEHSCVAEDKACVSNGKFRSAHVVT
jgi:hypothetical protein